MSTSKHQMFVISKNNLDDLIEEVKKVDSIVRYHTLILPITGTSYRSSHEGIPYRYWCDKEGNQYFDCAIETSE